MITILLVILLTIAIVLAFHYRNQRVEIIKFNNAQQEKLENSIKQRQEQLKLVEQQLDQQTERISQINETAQKMREEAERQAYEWYSAKVRALTNSYNEKNDKLTREYTEKEKEYQNKIETEQNKLLDLENKQLAYIRAQQRQEEINANQDYYRLAIDSDAKEDISLLRDIQKRLIKKETIDKVIWEVYYKPAYDILMSHLFQSNNKVSGIYKLTCLTTGKQYIGQSVDMRERARQHVKNGLAHGVKTNKLYQEMYKYGPDDFIFEILEEVPKDKLNEREKYYIEFYNTREQLNSTVGGA